MKANSRRGETDYHIRETPDMTLCHTGKDNYTFHPKGPKAAAGLTQRTDTVSLTDTNKYIPKGQYCKINK